MPFDNDTLSVMQDLGIDPAASEASDLDLGAEELSMEAEAAEAKAEDSGLDEGEETDVEELKADEAQPEGEEVETTAEAVEEPKTAKELQEIESKRLELDLKEKTIMERWEKEKTEFLEKHETKIKEYDQFDSFLGHLADKDPELFQLLQNEYKEHSQHYSNPIIDKALKETSELRSELNQIKQRFSDEATRVKLDSEMSQLKSTLGKEAEAAGLKVDWSKVEDAWADNPKLGLDNAFYAVHGAALVKAAASKAKVEAVTKKVQARPQVATAGAVKRSVSSGEVDWSKMDSDAAIRLIARQVTGKAS